jgi:hypothetical protein
VPNKIWEKVNLEFIKEYGENYQGLWRDQVTKLVYNERRAETGVNAICEIEIEYSGRSQMAFLRQSTMYHDKDKVQRMMCVAVPQLLKLLLYAKVSNT